MPTILTSYGLEKIKQELDHVNNVSIPKAEARHKLAKAYGYTKGDFEYDDSKAERDFHRKRIDTLAKMIAEAKII